MSRVRGSKAFEAMKALGIKSHIVKPVLKNLLKVYDNNWELIEEENYRVLADAIFDSQDSKEGEDKNEENWINDEPVPPRKRLRLRQEDGPSSLSVPNSSMTIGESSPRRPKMDVAVSPQSCLKQELAALDSPQADPGEKRTEALSVQLTTRGKKLVSERIPNASCFKEPKVKPGIVLPKEDAPSNALIKPKSEPCTCDFPEFEIPIAVIHPAVTSSTRNEAHPDPVCKEGFAAGNDSTGHADSPDSMVSKCVKAVGEGKEDGVPGVACMSGTVLSVPEAASSSFEIASSDSGEVKLSLTCNPALDRFNFQMPSLDAVLKMAEEKCLKSYKIIEPSFSLKKLMKELCQCCLDLGNNSRVEKLGKDVNITPTLDFSKKSNIETVLGAKTSHLHGKVNMPASSLNGSPDCRNPSEVVPRLLAHGRQSSTHSNGNLSGSSKNECNSTQKEREGSEIQELNSRSLVAIPQCRFSIDEVKPLHDVNDICKGEESVKISLVNEVSSEPYPPTFYYIPQNIVYQNAYVSFSLARIGDEHCCSDCFGDCLSSAIPCACARETGGEYAYTPDGLVKEKFMDECISMNRDPQKHSHVYCKDCPLERSKYELMPDPCKGHLVRKFIKECWSKCGCNKQCGNRVVQRGITRNLQVFLTPEGKGWGVRTLEDLPRGAFVCEYVGEVLTNTELYDRNMQSTGNEKHTYPVLLDADWGSEKVLKDEEALCLDATFYGNVARFINHRCFDANLVEIPVEVETPDHHYYHLAFFTTRKVEALEELSWDYGIDFEDHNHPVKAFRCHCSSKCCRDMKRRGKRVTNGKRTKPGALILR
ncbi:putative inactive histone-lysine N-methyltransferase SUVR2 isoform X2 [Tasmannia lanceolata]|uniref:putative inactive histone-lysine N-methyltransferase SUVR2 isoform X2 n=1 Tax=Tasmannia lanceolata TaxID=3420 RepID=UPI004062AEC4